MRILRIRQLYLGLLLIACLFSSCAPKTAPPAARSVTGSLEGVLYSYHYWKEGLAILIWHDLSYGESTCSGRGSTEDPVYRIVCDVEAQDGRRLNWEIHSRDGVTAQMWIDNERYNLAEGTMFLVSSQVGRTRVVQLQRDLAELSPDNEAITAFANMDSDIASFINRIKAPNS